MLAKTMLRGDYSGYIPSVSLTQKPLTPVSEDTIFNCSITVFPFYEPVIRFSGRWEHVLCHRTEDVR